MCISIWVLTWFSVSRWERELGDFAWRYAFVKASRLLRCFCCLNSPVCFAYHYRPTTNVMVSIVSMLSVLISSCTGLQLQPKPHSLYRAPALDALPHPLLLRHVQISSLRSGRLAFDWNPFLFGYCNCVKGGRQIDVFVFTHLIGIFTSCIIVDVHYIDSCIIIFGLTLEKSKLREQWCSHFSPRDCYIDSGKKWREI